VTARTWSCPRAEDTEATGRRLATDLVPGDIVLLIGDLAAGKTTFVRGLVGGLGGRQDDVDSPTFVLVQSYPVTARGLAVVHHVDLYRLGETLSDLREVGLEELLNDPAAVITVEWPKDALAVWIPTGTRVLRVRITVEPDEVRRITIEG
jgi:tRNA threonylcarbamoyladenosine biosynthesis protein TsaE